MAVLRPNAPAQRGKLDTDALAALAARQSGVVSRAQLESAGVSDSALSRWVAGRRLHRIHPGVYAVGHTSLSLDARLFAARLYGGDQAVFSHTTAAWIWSLIDAEPKRIHITVPGRRRSLPDVRLHHSREVDPVEHQGLPVTSVPRTLLDLGSTLSPRRLRRALAEADYRGLLDPVATLSTLGRGRPGSRELRMALAHHLPSLAETDGRLEERFLELCESAQLPLPKVNAPISRMRVDAVWEEQRLAVEVDGGPAHGSWARIKRDRQRELALRAEGFQVVRYTWDQVTRRSGEVVADLRHLLT